MTWAKLDDKLHSRADTLAAGNEAMGVWVRCESYCADHETDGHLPRAVVELISGGKKSMHRLGGLLVKAGLWSETPGGYLSVGFLDRNPSKADADAKRAAETARKKAQRDRRPGIGPTDVPHGVPPGQDAESHPLSHPCPAPPVPDPYPNPSSPAEKSNTPRARRDPDPPPDPRVTSAVERWLAAHARMVPTAMLEAGSVMTVARDFTPEHFEAGVEHHIGETDLGVWQRVPLKYLRKRCEWARDRPKPTAKRAQGPPSSLPPGVKPYTADYDGPRIIGVLR